MKIIAVIPVKSTSSRVKNKNIRLLGDKPLFLHTLEKLLEIDKLDEVWIDTDSMEIIQIANDYNYKNFKFFIREKQFASNKTDGNKLLENEINNIDSDIYLQVLCTSPFTKISSIEKCINLLLESKYNSVVGCSKEKLYLWNNNKPLYDINNLPNSFDLDDTVIESMSIYGITKEEFLKTKIRIGLNPYLLELDKEESLDINYENDFILCNKIAKLNTIHEYFNLNLLKNKINSCMISDILNDLKLKSSNFLLSDFKLNIDTNVLFGRVKPIQIRELEKDENTNDIYKCLDSYKTISPGNIIFVNNKVKDKAYFGDLNATISMSKNAQGTIVNGFTRDINRTIDLKYPVFFKNNTCNDVKFHGTLDYYDKPININNINIYVNNLIFADKDGIIIIPKNLEKIVLNKCKNIIKNESNIFNSLILGENISDIININGYF